MNQKYSTAVLILSFIFNLSLMAENNRPRWHNFKVFIRGLETERGTVRLALYNKNLFMNKKMAVRTGAVAARRDSCIWVLNKIFPGDYAIVAYQDINNNKKMDTGFLGRAKEPFAFSGSGHKKKWGAPRFEEVKFTVNENLIILDLNFPPQK